MAHLPEKVLSQRMRLQLESIESPSELPGKKSTDLSPMTDLAFNLCDTSLSSGTPNLIIKKKLTMDYESSPSPSSSHDHSSDSGTPLAAITNKPKGRPGARSIVRCATAPTDFKESNKENIPLMSFKTGSPLKSPSKCVDSPLALKDRMKIIQSPDKTKSFQVAKPFSQKRPLFKVLEDDESSRDSGYSSQPLEEVRLRKKSRCESQSQTEVQSPSMEDILADCSPSKEGFSFLSRSPSSKSSKANSDGFELDSLGTLPEMPEEENEESPSLTFASLLEKRILSSPRDNFSRKTTSNTSSPVRNKFSFRRALSMVDQPSPSCLNSESPVSRNSDPKAGFKRPEPPVHAGNCLLGRKKRSNATVERSASLQYSSSAAPRPSLQRSQSEIAIKRSCEFKDDNDDALPDSRGKYCLPSKTGMSNNHPNLRSITCHTLKDLIDGKHKESVNSFRIIDVRYKFEYEGGHILGAENWQHGEDEEFLSAIMPVEPLSAAPEPGDHKEERRNILIFHCEFSSQRAPDFYKKLRERDRNLHENVYPALHYPECYLLHLGYKEFFNNYPDLCTGRYTEMVDPRYGNELRIMRAKSKSWSGGTVSRTGTMSRKFQRY